MRCGVPTMAPSVQKKPAAHLPAGRWRPDALQKWPGRQGVHSDLAWRLVKLEKVPLGQGDWVALAVFDAHQWPLGQSSWRVAPRPQ